MRIMVNGAIMNYGATLTVSELLKDLSLDNRYVVVEINEELVDKQNFASYRVNEGDKIEIIKFVGGG